MFGDEHPLTLEAYLTYAGALKAQGEYDAAEELYEEALACDQKIELLKRELGFSSGSEFKFGKLRKDQRIKFFEAVLPYSFFYFGVVINKDPQKLYGNGFRIKESFYKGLSRNKLSNYSAHIACRGGAPVVSGIGGVAAATARIPCCEDVPHMSARGVLELISYLLTAPKYRLLKITPHRITPKRFVLSQCF